MYKKLYTPAKESLAELFLQQGSFQCVSEVLYHLQYKKEKPLCLFSGSSFAVIPPIFNQMIEAFWRLK